MRYLIDNTQTLINESSKTLNFTNTSMNAYFSSDALLVHQMVNLHSKLTSPGS
jgi:hypothetical protein